MVSWGSWAAIRPVDSLALGDGWERRGGARRTRGRTGVSDPTGLDIMKPRIDQSIESSCRIEPRLHSSLILSYHFLTHKPKKTKTMRALLAILSLAAAAAPASAFLPPLPSTAWQTGFRGRALASSTDSSTAAAEELSRKERSKEQVCVCGGLHGCRCAYVGGLVNSVDT